ncbi:MAG: lytic transglycosylase domain-containing protein [Pseudomonadota bacterium]
MQVLIRIVRCLTVVALSIWLIGLHPSASVFAQGIEQLLLERVPIPQKRPDRVSNPLSVKTTSALPTAFFNEKQISPLTGSLSDGLKALDSNNVERAMRIRAGMPSGSLDRKLLAWAIAVSGKEGVPASTITKVVLDLPDWPAQKALRRNAERALRFEGLDSRGVIDVFSGSQPSSVEGAMLLSRAYLDNGNRSLANRAIAPFWREETLNRTLERKILDQVGASLTREDHRFRMHQLLYRDRATAAIRIAGLAEQVSLAKARAAALRKAPNADRLISAVAASSKKDTGFTFAKIEHARRSGDYRKAADLLLSATRDPNKLIDPDEWWVERRIVSRQMLELGKFEKAYRLAAEHSAQSPAKIAEAEFHAGWYALRFLGKKALARRHFAEVIRVSKRPISLARGHYWMGRASDAANASQHYREAAKHIGTFYGQLATHELKSNRLRITRTAPNQTDRTRLRKRELYRAIKRFENVGHAWRAEPFYRHLARTLQSPGEIAILAADAERLGKFNLSLQIGKVAFGRGLKVDTLSWPIGAIPKTAKIGDTGLALAYAIARQERAFDKAAVSSANAKGLLQLLPGTAKAVAKRNGLQYSRRKLTTDAGYNATLGAAYLSEQLARYGNSYILTFAAYNAGPGRVDEWIGRFGDPRGKSLYDVIDWIEGIPFTETRHYVQRIMENYQIYKNRISNSPLSIRKDLTKGRS